MSHFIKYLRQKLGQQPYLLFLFCLLVCSLAIALPGFLWFYFWQRTGFFISLFLGFIIGSALIGLFEVLCLGSPKPSKDAGSAIQSNGENQRPNSVLSRRLVLFTTSLITFIMGCLMGSAVQHGKTGWHYQIRDSKVIHTDLGPVQWSYVTESVGLPFMDTGTTVVEWNGRTLYKAKRGFQENYPFADNVRPSKNAIEWEDGKHSYHLTIEEKDSNAKD